MYIPGHSVISNCSMPTEKASEFLDYHLKPIMKTGMSYRGVSRDYLGIAVFIGKVTKRKAEGIATLQSSDNIRHHNKI